ncbi:MAG: hypothetical protein ABSG58_07215 [Acidimicrobiales bacterium]
MAVTILVILIFGCICFGVYKGRSQRAAQNSGKLNYRARMGGGVRRFTSLGRPVITSDQQRAEWIQLNRDRYDASIDRLDPRHADYQEPDETR